LRWAARVREWLRRRVANPQFRPVMRVALAAAAMIPLAMALLINIRPASGLSVDGMTVAVKHVDNVHILSFGQDLTKPTREYWVARRRDWIMSQDAAQRSLSDIGQHQWRAVFSDGTSETAEMEPEDIEIAKDAINRILALVWGDIPVDRESQPLARVPVSDVHDANEVYELTWENSSNGDLSLGYRLRVSLEPGRRLPGKAEYFWKTPDDPQWRNYRTVRYVYPSPEQMEQARKELFSGQ
jgi:hypothetical protein